MLLTCTANSSALQRLGTLVYEARRGPHHDPTLRDRTATLRREAQQATMRPRVPWRNGQGAYTQCVAVL